MFLKNETDNLFPEKTIPFRGKHQRKRSWNRQLKDQNEDNMTIQLNDKRAVDGLIGLRKTELNSQVIWLQRLQLVDAYVYYELK